MDVPGAAAAMADAARNIGRPGVAAEYGVSWFEELVSSEDLAAGGQEAGGSPTRSARMVMSSRSSPRQNSSTSS